MTSWRLRIGLVLVVVGLVGVAALYLADLAWEQDWDGVDLVGNLAALTAALPAGVVALTAAPEVYRRRRLLVLAPIVAVAGSLALSTTASLRMGPEPDRAWVFPVAAFAALVATPVVLAWLSLLPLGRERGERWPFLVVTAGGLSVLLGAVTYGLDDGPGRVGTELNGTANTLVVLGIALAAGGLARLTVLLWPHDVDHGARVES